MLKLRIITALILITLVSCALFLLQLPLFVLLVSFIILLAGWEWDNMMCSPSKTRFDFQILLAMVLMGLMIYSYQSPVTHFQFWPSFIWPRISDIEYPAYILYAAVPWWIFALCSVVVYQTAQIRLISGRAMELLAGLMILLPLYISLISFRNQGLTQGDFYIGGLFIFYGILVVAGADIGGYVLGKLIGKTKLATRISPGKTWEGVLGGILGAQLFGFLGAIFLLQLTIKNSWLFAVMLFAVTLFSVVGDLIVSMQKRHKGLKDSSHLLPGHGGLLDRLDSLAAAFPLLFISMSYLGYL